MSTNYYFNPNEASPLHCYGQLHIGKSSAGWSFSFQGYDFGGGKIRAEVGNSGLGIQVAAPPCVIKSVTDWSKVLLDGTIEDEYGCALSFEQLAEVVIGKRPSGKLLNHALEYPSERTWVDAEGYSFSSYDFS